jgi:hypothetical protein
VYEVEPVRKPFRFGTVAEVVFRIAVIVTTEVPASIIGAYEGAEAKLPRPVATQPVKLLPDTPVYENVKLP